MNRRTFLKTLGVAAVVGGIGVVGVKSYYDYFYGENKPVPSGSGAQAGTGSSGSGSGSSTGKTAPRYFFIIYMDGMHPLYIEKFQPPNLMQLLSESVYFPNANVGHMTSNTIVSHAVGNAGLYPKTWGVVDYGWRNTLSDEQLAKIVPPGKTIAPSDYNLIVNYRLPDLILRHYENDMVSFAKWVKTYYGNNALTAGVSTKQYVATYLAHMDMRILGKNENGTIAPYYQLGPAEKYISDVQISANDILQKADSWVAEVSKRLVANVKPTYMLINMPDIDLNAHRNGGPGNLEAMYNVVMEADKQLGEFIDALKQAGIYDQSAIIITADHGFAAGYGEELYRDRVKSALEAAGFKVDYITGGEGYLSVWLSDPQYKDNATKMKAAQTLASVLAKDLNMANSIIGVYYKAIFTTPAGMHIQYLPVMDLGRPEAIELLRTITSESGPDIVAMLGDHVNAYNDSTTPVNKKYVAGHGGAGWMVQNVPMIIKSPNLPKGVVIETVPYQGPRHVDMAPTLASLAGDPAYARKFDGRDLTGLIELATKINYRI